MKNSDLQYSAPTILVSIFGWVSLLGGILIALAMTFSIIFYAYIQGMSEGDLFPAEEIAQFPAAAKFLFGHLQLFSALNLLAGVMGAVAGFGVIKRRDWGRRLAIFLLAGSIVLAFAYIPLSFTSEDTPTPGYGRYLMVIMNVVQALVFGALHGWLIWKFRTPAVRGEFLKPCPESTV